MSRVPLLFSARNIALKFCPKTFPRKLFSGKTFFQERHLLSCGSKNKKRPLQGSLFDRIDVANDLFYTDTNVLQHSLFLRFH